MRFLFVKHALAWPRSSGHDVHGSQMIRALAGLGHEVALATVRPTIPAAVEGLPLEAVTCLEGEADPSAGTPLAGLAERYRSYWGIDPGRIAAAGRIAREWGADAVVVVGLEVLPYLGAVDGPLRVWYAGDEWAWHHLSLIRPNDPRTWGELKVAAIKGLYERVYAPMLDRVWVVSEADRRAMRWALGHGRIDVVPNGVDAGHYRPRGPSVPERPRSCVFWGRLDFEPNVQALQWFRRRVWPRVRERAADASFTIYGFRATEAVRSLAGRDGVELVPDLPDLRDEIAGHEVVVLPFVSGGGIKNKLLEAAAMGRPILATPQAANGLGPAGNPPLVLARPARRWVGELEALWGDPGRRRDLGERARAWAISEHTWEAAARRAVAGLDAGHRTRPVPLLPAVATGA